MKSLDRLLEEGKVVDRDLVLRDIKTICFKIAAKATELSRVEFSNYEHARWGELKALLIKAQDDFHDLTNKIRIGCKQNTVRR